MRGPLDRSLQWQVVGLDGAAVGLDIAGLDGEKDGFVGLDGVHDVLRCADPQQGEGAGVDLPEGPGELADDLVVHPLGEAGMEVAVFVEEGVALLGVSAHVVHEGVHRRVVGAVVGLDEIVGHRQVEGDPGLNDVTQGSHRVLATHRQPEHHPVDERVQRHPPDEGAMTVTHLDDVQGPQRADRLADRRARDTESLTELGLGRHKVTWAETRVDDVLLDRIGRRPGRGLARCAHRRVVLRCFSS